jgi:Arc/MetJ family transcription regulator
MRKTTIAIDDEAAAAAGLALGTVSLTATVNAAMREVAAMASRRRMVDRLTSMDGLDLDKPEVMDTAWR